MFKVVINKHNSILILYLTLDKGMLYDFYHINFNCLKKS